MKAVGSASATNYRTLNQWRGVAALSVMVFHGFGVARLHGQSVHHSIQWLEWLAGFGGFGVEIFFVISGYCIAANIYNLGTRGIGPIAFLRDRALRVVPAYWAACTCAIVVDALAAPFNGVPLSANIPAGVTGWAANVLLLQPFVTPERSILLVSWSLVYEVGFYMMVAAGYALFRHNSSLWMCSGIAGIFAILSLFGPHTGIFYALNFWPYFLFGMITFVAVLVRSPRRLLSIGLMSLPPFFALASWWTPGPVHGLEALTTAFFAVLIYVLQPWDSTMSNLRGLRWLAGVGMISYSLYLIHVPVAGRIVNLGIRWIAIDSAWFLGLQLSYWLLAISCAAAFFAIVERRVEIFRHGLRAREASEANNLQQNGRSC